MMLDVSGSMSGRKIQALRDAAQDLAEIVLDTSHGPSLNKIAIAPYSTADDVGTYARAATGVRKSHSCVTERTGAQAFTDADPSVPPLVERRAVVRTARSFHSRMISMPWARRSSR